MLELEEYHHRHAGMACDDRLSEERNLPYRRRGLAHVTQTMVISGRRQPTVRRSRAARASHSPGSTCRSKKKPCWSGSYHACRIQHARSLLRISYITSHLRIPRAARSITQRTEVDAVGPATADIPIGELTKLPCLPYTTHGTTTVVATPRAGS